MLQQPLQYSIYKWSEDNTREIVFTIIWILLRYEKVSCLVYNANPSLHKESLQLSTMQSPFLTLLHVNEISSLHNAPHNGSMHFSACMLKACTKPLHAENLLCTHVELPYTSSSLHTKVSLNILSATEELTLSYVALFLLHAKTKTMLQARGVKFISGLMEVLIYQLSLNCMLFRILYRPTQVEHSYG